ncbi:LysM peptidoglycan-binding domain-containing protein [Paenibacillus favisporus]|uniref:LysM peptidoglycan-binding domain-containing protein n=1 Tax=Paenibacillus favisporus TaxID=221028 RepID=UPI002DBC0CF5|nr:LysM peptidoglycan-binding domain-containing protein [Paenibacillus favisporus]MEC0176018.1 LysM peptidoglycan-binding domain-containing protein [Paenibacillus favisporus]
MKIHMVKSGDTLYELSKKYGVPLQKIIDANPQISDPNQLTVGQKVKIPAEPIQVPNNDQIIHKHVVKQGDSLWKLSKAWGVTLKDMIDANPQLKNPNALLVGEVVNIPKVGGVTAESVDGNANAKTIPGNKTYTGPKEELTAPIEENVKPEEAEKPNKEELTAPMEENKEENNAQVLPQQLPELPNIPSPPPLPNLSMNQEMPEMTSPNYTFPNVMPIAENQPNVMPAAENQPNVMPIMENKPNIMPAVENQPNVMPAAEKKPTYSKETIYSEVTHNLFIQYPGPVHEVASYHDMPNAENANLQHAMQENKQKTPYYPGIVQGTEYEPGPNAYPTGVSPAYAPHWENHEHPVAYEPIHVGPAHYQPNEAFPHSVEPAFYHPVHAGIAPYSPCGCQGVVSPYSGVDPFYAQPYSEPIAAYPNANAMFPNTQVSPAEAYPNQMPMVSPAEAYPNQMPMVSPAEAYPNYAPMTHYPEVDPAYAYPHHAYPTPYDWCYPSPYGMGVPSTLGAYDHAGPNAPFVGAAENAAYWDRNPAPAYPAPIGEEETQATATINEAAVHETSEVEESEPAADETASKKISDLKDKAKVNKSKAPAAKKERKSTVADRPRKNPWING